ESRMCIFGEERLDAIDDIHDNPELATIEHYLFVTDKGDTERPEWSRDMERDSQYQDSINPADSGENTLGEIAMYIYTSGTTGLPKASVISNRRFLMSSALSYLGGLRCNEDDCIYLCLPMYHGTGLFLGVGAALSTGACLFIRRKFSASRFIQEVREHKTTCFVYIGELCRYLLNTPAQPSDADTPLVRAMGNGLRPDVWHEFKNRFGIDRLAEFYGSSEGNVGFVNMLNKDCTVGMTSLPMALVQYDVETGEVIRDAQGHCMTAADGEPGLLLGKITESTVFEGYTSTEETEKKIIRNAFEPDDAWFNTGDLMRTVDVGFSLGFKHYQFVDRLGDTFRWKGENVSTNEVGEILNGFEEIDFCNVFGVEIPGTNGRAGMAALMLNDDVGELDSDGLSHYVCDNLPAYARPVFLRIQPKMDTTGTFKMVKGDLVKQGFDPSQVSDPLFVMRPRSERYEPMTPEIAAEFRAGNSGF
ncbi:MAG: AMP-binding protein, partial [Pseudomonadota bacterium]